VPKRDTKHGFRDPDKPERQATGGPIAQDQPPASPLADGPVIPAPATTPSIPSGGPVDIDVRRETGEPGLLDGPWVAVELWTRNRIYALGATLLCIEVRNRSDGVINAEHASLGARLVGGQRRNDSGLIIEVSHPFPEVGSAAVFATGLGNRLRVSETSHVTRVLIRQRVVTVGPNGELPSWDEITDSSVKRK
jgi:hypothetical protein